MWEKSKNLSIATEIRMFDFLKAEIEYYHKKTTDLLLEVPVSRTTGFASYWDNVGEMTNQGVELSLQSTNMNTNDFTWTTTLNLSHNKNVIDKLNGEDNVGTFPFILREGESFNSIYLRDWAGVNNENGHAQWYVLENEKRVDKDNDGKWDVTEDSSKAGKRIVGKGDPLFTGSLKNDFSYKGFDLSFMFTFKVGGDAYVDAHSNIYDDGKGLDKAVTKLQIKDVWSKDNPNGTLPIASLYNKQNSNYNSSRRLVDATYARLKNITLGYNLPKDVISRVGMNNVRVYASAANVLTFSKMDGFDPESTSRGVVLSDFDFPPMKTFTFGVQVNF